MVTVQQYREAVRANRRWEYCILAAILYMFAVMVGGGLLLSSFGNAGVDACSRWIVQRAPSHWEIWLTFTAVFLPICLLVAAPAVVLLRLKDCRKRRDRRLVCPHCDAFLFQLAALTGNCSRCGERVLDDLTPAASCGQQLFSVADFISAVRKRQTLRDPHGRNPGIRCPCCQVELTRNRFFVVATRKCPTCQAIVLEDPEPSVSADMPHLPLYRPSLAEFRAAHWSHVRWTLIGILVLIPAAGVLYCLFLASLEDRLTRLVGNAGFGIIAFATFILGMVLAAWVAELMGRYIRRKRHLNCLHCGQSLVSPSGIVIAARRCFHCGRRALADETAVAARWS
jgi:hypothetical protein